jgi:hypothetical protein
MRQAHGGLTSVGRNHPEAAEGVVFLHVLIVDAIENPFAVRRQLRVGHPAQGEQAFRGKTFKDRNFLYGIGVTCHHDTKAREGDE